MKIISPFLLAVNMLFSNPETFAQCPYTGEGDWVTACCTEGAKCLVASGQPCYSSNLTSSACQATEQCLKAHPNCKDCMDIWGLSFCSLQGKRYK